MVFSALGGDGSGAHNRLSVISRAATSAIELTQERLRGTQVRVALIWAFILRAMETIIAQRGFFCSASAWVQIQRQ